MKKKEDCIEDDQRGLGEDEEMKDKVSKPSEGILASGAMLLPISDQEDPSLPCKKKRKKPKKLPAAEEAGEEFVQAPPPPGAEDAEQREEAWDNAVTVDHGNIGSKKRKKSKKRKHSEEEGGGGNDEHADDQQERLPCDDVKQEQQHAAVEKPCSTKAAADPVLEQSDMKKCATTKTTQALQSRSTATAGASAGVATNTTAAPPPPNSKSLFRRITNTVHSIILPLGRKKRLGYKMKGGKKAYPRLPKRTSFILTEEDALRSIVRKMYKDCPVLSRHADKEAFLVKLMELMDSVLEEEVGEEVEVEVCA